MVEQAARCEVFRNRGVSRCRGAVPAGDDIRVDGGHDGQAFAAARGRRDRPCGAGLGVGAGAPGTVGAETVRGTLTSPGAWLLNWPDILQGNLAGNAILTFEARGTDLAVRIEISAANVSRERPAAVSGQGVSFDACRETGVVLRATPDDPVYAFRGASAQRWYTLTPCKTP